MANFARIGMSLTAFDAHGPVLYHDTLISKHVGLRVVFTICNNVRFTGG